MTVSYLPLLLRRKRLLFISGVLTAVLAFAVSRALPLTYGSEGSLLVDTHTPYPNEPSNAEQINVTTQIDVLKSPGLLRQVVRNYKLAEVTNLIPKLSLPRVMADKVDKWHDELIAFVRSIQGKSERPSDRETDQSSDSETDHKIIQYLQKHMWVSAKENSNVILVEVEAGEPKVAAMVVNAIMSTYMTTLEANRLNRIAQTEALIQQGMKNHQEELRIAGQRVTDYVEAHNLSEVQGSLTSAIQLSHKETQLALAQEDLVRKQAALDTVMHGGSVAGAQEALESKIVQILKEHDARVNEQINLLPSGDPRRTPLQAELASVRTQLGHENELILASLTREAAIARIKVSALQSSVQQENAIAQGASVAGTTVRQLTADLEAKRQLYVAFLTQAGQIRAATQQAPSVHVLFQAVPPEQPIRSIALLAVGLGFISGMSVASACIVAQAIFDNRINSTDEMAEVTGLPVFGSLPNVKPSYGNTLLTAPNDTPLIKETFRALWLEMRSRQNEGTSIVVTSSEVEEGKTTFAVALAHRFAEDGHRVLLVDADLRRPRLSSTLKRRQDQSLEAVLFKNVAFEQAVCSVRPGLDCLLNSGKCTNPVEVLASESLKLMLSKARQAYDFVIFDSPPVLHVADPVVLAAICQQVIFIVQAGRLRTELVFEATQRFPESDRGKIITLLTRVSRARLDGRDYYSGYISGAQA